MVIQRAIGDLNLNISKWDGFNNEIGVHKLARILYHLEEIDEIFSNLYYVRRAARITAKKKSRYDLLFQI